jgi:hypothetical protein
MPTDESEPRDPHRRCREMTTLSSAHGDIMATVKLKYAH